MCCRVLLPNLVVTIGLLLFTDSVQAANYYVGGDLSCTHPTVQAAINAAEANPGADTIYIARSAIWTQQALTISTSQELDLEGGYETCGNPAGDGTFTVLDGAGGSAAPVLSITGNTGSIIRLRYLSIVNGDPSGNGGAINYSGNGSLQIGNCAISGNNAAKGGGIYANGTGGSAELLLFANVAVTGNGARGDGGGVFVNAMSMAMLSPDSIIANNHADGEPGTTGYGGGLVVRSDSGRSATAYIGSGGVGALGAIYGNQAVYGGGVAVSGGDGAEANATLLLYSTEADKPAAIRGNFASAGGGGIYLWPDESFGNFSYAIAKLWNAEITGNAAPEGAAVFVDNSTNAGITTGGELNINDTPPSGALACPVGLPCGRIAGNVTQTAGGVPTAGGIVYVTDNSTARIGGSSPGVAIQDNQAGRLFQVNGGAYDVQIQSSLVTGNQVSLELVRGEGSSEIYLFNTTISDNSIGASTVLAVGINKLFMRGTILWQPGMISTTPAQPAANPNVAWSIASETLSLGDGPGAIVAAPRFIDPPRGDYRLRAASPAVDYAPPLAGDDRDLFNLPRDQRLNGVWRTVPENGRDVGAFERPALQPLVLNADFDGDLNIWKYLPDDMTAYDVDNAPGSPAGTGSARVSGSSDANHMDGSFQCIHLPGPGRYRLNGWSHSSGTPLTRNMTALAWEYRANGGEGCLDGPVTVGGAQYLGAQASWGQPVDAAIIDVPEAEWNSNTSLTILMTVLANGADTSFHGWFDGITVTLDGSDVIFADGFE